LLSDEVQCSAILQLAHALRWMMRTRTTPFVMLSTIPL
jgi:hypothetical protein